MSACPSKVTVLKTWTLNLGLTDSPFSSLQSFHRFGHFRYSICGALGKADGINILALLVVQKWLDPWNCCRFTKLPCQDGIVEGPYGFAEEADRATEEWSSTGAGKVGYLSTGAEELEPSHLRFFRFVGLSVMKTEFGTSMAANPVLSKHPSFCGGGRGTPIVLETKSLWGKTKKKNESWQPHHQYSSLDPGDILR